MSNAQEIDKQANDRNIFNAALEDEVRGWFYEDVIHSLDAKALRQCQNVFIELIDVLREDPQGARRLEREMILWLEEVFKNSPAYQTAFELYTSFQTLSPGKISIEGSDLEDMLEQIMAKKLAGPPRITLLRANDVQSAASSQAAPDSQQSTGSAKPSSYGTFAKALIEIAGDPQMPDEISAKIIDIVSQLCEASEPGASGEAAQKVVRAERFELIDINGNLCAELYSMTSPGGAGARTIFSLKGPHEQEVSLIADGLTGEMSFQILDHENDSYPVYLGTDMDAKSVSLDFFDETLLEVRRPKGKAPQKVNAMEAGALGVSPRTAFNLCEYEKLSLGFFLKEDGEKAFEFELIRDHSERQTEIYFNTQGANCSYFNRDGYNFPLRGNARAHHEDDITLSGEGRIDFLGDKDERVFSLIWRWLEDQFEADFNVYDAKGNVVQVFGILE
jgi:hypothetical protein